MKHCRAIILAVLLLPCFWCNAFGLGFVNQFVEFTLPEASAQCTQEGLDWFCECFQNDPKRALLIYAWASQGSNTDFGANYEKRLLNHVGLSGTSRDTLTMTTKRTSTETFLGSTWNEATSSEQSIPLNVRIFVTSVPTSSQDRIELLIAAFQRSPVSSDQNKLIADFAHTMKVLVQRTRDGGFIMPQPISLPLSSIFHQASSNPFAMSARFWKWVDKISRH